MPKPPYAQSQPVEPELSLKLWDEENERLVRFAAARSRVTVGGRSPVAQ
ncbi:MAG: hypothetical protein H0V29_13790 [Thermoleophilaceae bacterium]|nr:hypothetical protein [Thermoleophilaceae bacterium]